jgi:hypothetical protein
MAAASALTTRRRAPKKGADRAERDKREALGRSRGGYGTKARVIADGRGRAVAFALAPCQAHELSLAPGLIGCLPDVPGRVVGDRGLASDAFRTLIWDIGARLAIPPKERMPLSALDLRQPPPRREPLGPPQGMARRRHALRKNRMLLLGRPVPGCNRRLAQGLTGPNAGCLHASAPRVLGRFALPVRRESNVRAGRSSVLLIHARTTATGAHGSANVHRKLQ